MILWPVCPTPKNLWGILLSKRLGGRPTCGVSMNLGHTVLRLGIYAAYVGVAMRPYDPGVAPNCHLHLLAPSIWRRCWGLAYINAVNKAKCAPALKDAVALYSGCYP